MARDGSNQTQLTFSEGGYPIVVSPDGRWLYYRSGLNRTIRRVTTESGLEELVLDHIGDYPTVSPDAAQAAWVEFKDGEGSIVIRTLPDGNVVKTFKLAEPNLDVSWLMWTPDGKKLAYILAASDVQRAYLWMQPINGQPPQRVADLSGDEIAEVSALALASDGKTFAVIKGNWKHNAVLLRGLK
jgi:Tol biopolymer transport system component